MQGLGKRSPQRWQGSNAQLGFVLNPNGFCKPSALTFLASSWRSQGSCHPPESRRASRHQDQHSKATSQTNLLWGINPHASYAHIGGPNGQQLRRQMENKDSSVKPVGRATLRSQRARCCLSWQGLGADPAHIALRVSQDAVCQGHLAHCRRGVPRSSGAVLLLLVPIRAHGQVSCWRHSQLLLQKPCDAT